MASRDIARTVVEGGRSNISKFDRRDRNRRERRGVGHPVYGKLAVGRQFNDRLSPFFQWIDRQVGRRWDDVYSEFTQRFDRRKVKGWHLHTHLEYEVKNAGFRESISRWYDYTNYFVDDEGILRETERRRYRRELNAVQKENQLARKRARRRNGSRK